MIVVADSSPLNYLVLIGEPHLLPALFESVVIPPAVFEELQNPAAPIEVRTWLANPPSWLRIWTGLPDTAALTPALGAGERQAISLALQLGIHRVLLDETAGRQEATRMGVEVQGTLGVLERAAEMGLVNLPEVMSRLLKTNFRVSRKVLDEFLRRQR